MTHYTLHEQKQLAKLERTLTFMMDDVAYTLARWDAERSALEHEIVLKDALLERIITQRKGGFDPNQARAPSGTPEGGQWIRGAPESWSKPETFNRHYSAHKKDFKVNSSKEYVQKSQDLLKRAYKDRLPTLVNKDGFVKVYDPKTNSFGVYNSQGKTETFYKPKKGMKYVSNEFTKEASKGSKIVRPLSSGTRGSGLPITIRKPGFPNGRLPWDWNVY